MRKFVISTAILASFVLYSLFTKLSSIESEEHVIIPIASSKPSNLQVPMVSQTAVPSPTVSTMPIGKYKDGEYTGSLSDAFYGFIQVKAIIQNGKLTDVVFVVYPNDRSTSRFINNHAMPILKQEALVAQSGQVDIVSGATDSSRAFIQSLTQALIQAQ